MSTRAWGKCGEDWGIHVIQANISLGDKFASLLRLVSYLASKICLSISYFLSKDFTSILIDKNLCLTLWNGFWLVWSHVYTFEGLSFFSSKNFKLLCGWPTISPQSWWIKTCVWFCEMGFGWFGHIL